MPRKSAPIVRAQSRNDRSPEKRSTPDTPPDTDLITLAKLTLQRVCRDENAPAAARAQAARTLLEATGALKSSPAADTKPASEFTIAELDARIEALDTQSRDAHDRV